MEFDENRDTEESDGRKRINEKIDEKIREKK